MFYNVLKVQLHFYYCIITIRRKQESHKKRFTILCHWIIGRTRRDWLFDILAHDSTTSATMNLANSKSSANRKSSHGKRDDWRCEAIIFVRIFRNRQRKDTIVQSSHNQVDTRTCHFAFWNGPFQRAKRTVSGRKKVHIRMQNGTNQNGVNIFRNRETFMRLMANNC